ncbi:hypothetical protein LXL04_013920 [Taraxacum kok-saghyz]
MEYPGIEPGSLLNNLTNKPTRLGAFVVVLTLAAIVVVLTLATEASSDSGSFDDLRLGFRHLPFAGFQQLRQITATSTTCDWDFGIFRLRDSDSFVRFRQLRRPAIGISTTCASISTVIVDIHWGSRVKLCQLEFIVGYGYGDGRGRKVVFAVLIHEEIKGRTV